MKELIIKEDESNQRFDKYLKRILKEASPSFIYKMLRKKNITLNDKKADGSEKLYTGDNVKIWFSDETFDLMAGVSKHDSLFESLKTVDCNIDVIYEDDDMLVINKPAGIKSQKDSLTDISINEMALSYMISKGQLNEETFKRYHPSVCNRLDRNTSGIILFAKNLHAAQSLTNALKERSCKKLYRAVVVGIIDKEQTIDGFLTKDNKTNKVTVSKNEASDSKRIQTSYRPIKIIDNKFTLLEIHLITGRTHQIRAHLSSVDHPILGDRKYGNNAINKGQGVRRQLLHAYQVEFEDGRKFICDLPEDFNEYI